MLPGLPSCSDDLASKRLAAPQGGGAQVSRLAFLFNPDHVDNELREAERAAAALEVKLHLAECEVLAISTLLDAAIRAGVDALYVGIVAANGSDSASRLSAAMISYRLPRDTT